MDSTPDAQIQHGGKPLLTIVGDKVALGPAHRDLLPLLNQWENDFTAFFLGGNVLRPITEGGTEAFLASTLKGEAREHILFMIYESASLRPIGWAMLRHLDAKNGTAEFGILIGEPDSRGKGYGTEVTRLMLDYALTVENLHNVVLDTAAHNERAIRAYTRAGFRVIGRRRQALCWGKKRYDSVLMDCPWRRSLKPRSSGS